LKTVGTVEDAPRDVVIGDARYSQGGLKTLESPVIPPVDFGPTQTYTPSPKSRPGTSGTMTQRTHNRTPSDSLTPKDEKRLSYGQASLNTGNDSRDHSGSPGGDDRRSMVWTPGAAVLGGRSSPGGRLTPEQFVQHRAQASRGSNPAYPQRTSSGNLMH